MLLLGYAGVKASSEMTDKLFAAGIVLMGGLLEFAVVVSTLQMRSGGITATRNYVRMRQTGFGDDVHSLPLTLPQLYAPPEADYYVPPKELHG